jgi:DNA-binding FadR family transcriptional regulator
MDEPIRQSDNSSDDVRVGLVERVIDDIRGYIRDNRLKPGDVLPAETALAEQMNVSRAVAREAFRALAALRILEIGNGRRARVAAPDAAALSMIIDHTVYTGHLSIQQVIDVRRTLEMRAASLAALRRSDAQARDLAELVQQMYAALDAPQQVMELDIRFHELIAQASGNALYAIIVHSFSVITRQTWQLVWRGRASMENRRENIRCHERIATAIAMQDPARVEAAMTEHFDSHVSVLLRVGIT